MQQLSYSHFLAAKAALDPMTGIYIAAEHGRRGLGVELKPSYYAQALRNLQSLADRPRDLFAGEAA